jgi:hypothetical protein
VLPFSVEVTSPSWRSSAEEWSVRRLAEHGIRVVGAVAQPRVRPWSTQLTFETDAGLVWFKADSPGLAFEPGLQQRISELSPGIVQVPLAVDTGRGWMLTVDHGPSLSDLEPPTPAEWGGLLADAARAQRRLAPHREALLATGLPDCAPATVPERFDELRAVLRRYPPEHPGHLSADGDARLAAARHAVVEACDVLAASLFPATWNHGDLHVHNAYRDGDALRFFDLGDGQWAHALEVLAVPLVWMRAQGLSAGEIRDALDAYFAEWGATASSAEMAAMRVVHAVNRSRTWWIWLDGTTADELERFAREPEEHLMSVIDVLADDEGPDVV